MIQLTVVRSHDQERKAPECRYVAVEGCRGTRPTRRRATPTDAGMRAQAEGSPRAVAAVAPRSRVGVFKRIYNVGTRDIF